MPQLVRQLYYEDKVLEAMEEADEQGGLNANDIYAEARVRKDGVQHRINEWLTVEMIDSEVGHVDLVRNVIREECTRLSERFKWDHREKTLVTILPREVEASWMPGRWGYFVDKVPYDKICLPYHLTEDLNRLAATTRHEFMHDITLNLTAGHASRWLSEGMSTYVEGYDPRSAVRDFQQGTAEWVSPTLLVGLFNVDNRREDRRSDIGHAYAQSNLLVRYLALQGGEPSLADLLHALGNESFKESLEIGMLSRTHVDEALRKVYHLTEAQLFRSAGEWVLTRPASGTWTPDLM